MKCNISPSLISLTLYRSVHIINTANHYERRTISKTHQTMMYHWCCSHDERPFWLNFNYGLLIAVQLHVELRAGRVFSSGHSSRSRLALLAGKSLRDSGQPLRPSGATSPKEWQPFRLIKVGIPRWRASNMLGVVGEAQHGGKMSKVYCSQLLFTVTSLSVGQQANIR